MILAVKLFMPGVHHIEPSDRILLSEQAPTQHSVRWFCMAELLAYYDLFQFVMMLCAVITLVMFFTRKK